MPRWRRARHAILALSVGLVFALGSSRADEWKPQTDDALPATTTLTRSADRRCSLATIRSSAANPGEEALVRALADRLSASGFKLDAADSATPGRAGFSRGDIFGHYVVNRIKKSETSGAAWQLRACFYRKRNENVCRPSCQKLL